MSTLTDSTEKSKKLNTKKFTEAPVQLAVFAGMILMTILTMYNGLLINQQLQQTGSTSNGGGNLFAMGLWLLLLGATYVITLSYARESKFQLIRAFMVTIQVGSTAVAVYYYMINDGTLQSGVTRPLFIFMWCTIGFTIITLWNIIEILGFKINRK